MTDEGVINKFLSIETSHIDEKIFKVSQPFLIGMIISLLNIDTKDYGMDIDAKSILVGDPLLHKDLSRKLRKESWNYQTAVGILHYLQGNIRP